MSMPDEVCRLSRFHAGPPAKRAAMRMQVRVAQRMPKVSTLSILRVAHNRAPKTALLLSFFQSTSRISWPAAMRTRNILRVGGRSESNKVVTSGAVTRSTCSRDEEKGVNLMARCAACQFLRWFLLLVNRTPKNMWLWTINQNPFGGITR